MGSPPAALLGETEPDPNFSVNVGLGDGDVPLAGDVPGMLSRPAALPVCSAGGRVAAGMVEADGVVSLAGDLGRPSLNLIPAGGAGVVEAPDALGDETFGFPESGGARLGDTDPAG